MIALRPLAIVLLATSLAGCGSASKRLSGQDYAPDSDEIPEGIQNTPDAVPRFEPRSRGGNAKTYTVFGKSYRVLDSAEGFKQRGFASWYGKKFHGRKTANGETYDIFAMTAAHKNLPLPTYVRVTNVSNGLSTVVRVNDRGPFHGDRIIDLSYAAAAKLDIVGHGTAKVEIEAITDFSKHPEPATPGPAEIKPIVRSGFLQVAAYDDPINAVALREDLESAGVGPIEIHIPEDEAPALHRVVIGPFDDEPAAADAIRRLEARGLSATWVQP